VDAPAEMLHKARIWDNPEARHVLDSMGELFLALDPDFRIVFVNRALESAIEGRIEGIVGRNHFEIWPEMLGSVVENTYRQSFKTGLPCRFEYYYAPANTWVDVNGYVIDDLLHVYFRDITSAKEREVIRRAQDDADRRYRALAEIAATVVFTADENGGLTELPLLRGVDPKLAHSALGSGWIDAVHPADRPSAITAWQAAVESNRPYETEFRIEMLNGEYRWHLARGVLLSNPDSSTREWIGACIDVHARVMQERGLRMLDQLGLDMREIREPYEIMSKAQRAVGEYLGASRVAYGEALHEGKAFDGAPNYCVGCEDLNGRYPITGFSSRISEGLRNGISLIVHDVAQELAPDEGGNAFLQFDIAAAICVPILKAGKLVAMMGVHQTTPRTWQPEEVDLAKSVAERCWSQVQRARAEQALLRSETRLRLILESATVGILVNDPDGTITFANPPLLRMLGYSHDDLERGDISWNKIQLPERRAMDDLALQQLKLTGHCDPYETEFLTNDGRRIPVYVGAAFIPNDIEEGILGAAFVTDLTDLKAVENELRALNEELDRRVTERTVELETAYRDQESYNYTVSHDLRAPLRAIIATSRIIEEDYGDQLPPAATELLARQATSAIRLATLVDELLRLSRLGRQEMHVGEIDLSQLAHDVADELGGLDRVRIQPGMMDRGDGRLLRLVWQNMLSNALKFSQPPSPIEAGYLRDNERKIYFVRDYGTGFDMAYAHKLFLPFERLVTDSEYPGTGIGLTSALKIVQRHRGTMWAEGTPGKGATFYFTLHET
jgi:PAS domain S-box-containing protein